jgi:hypothetical protein
MVEIKQYLVMVIRFCVSLTNLVGNSGVVATDVTGVGTAREALGATGYGLDKAIFAYGTTGNVVSLSNLVSQ